MSAEKWAKPYFALAFGICGVSTGAIFARLADAPAITIAAYRVGFTVVLLAPAIWISARRELRGLQARDFALAVLSGVFLAVHFATWISSLNYTSVANSVVLVNTNPIWVGVLTPIITGDRLRRQTMAAIVISVTGGIIIGWGDLVTGGGALWGDFLALCGSFCAAGYLLIGRHLRAKLGLLAYVGVCYGSAAVVLWSIVFLSGAAYSGFQMQTWAAFFGLALVSQVIGHTSYNWALKWFSANMIAISLLGEPILASLMAWWLFNEPLTFVKLVGGALILMGIYVASSAESVPERPQR